MILKEAMKTCISGEYPKEIELYMFRGCSVIPLLVQTEIQLAQIINFQCDAIKFIKIRGNAYDSGK
ncbi:hypothetical protein DVQ06_04615 [Yersinia enterocolitica]|nr:hypothetical protein [Yersinia enterocolitica]